MNVLVTLTSAGTDTGPFDLFSNADNYIIPIDGGISRAALLAGYTCTTVPGSATIIRVKSLGICTNYIDIPISLVTTTTTTSSSTTTTTTTAAPATTTTTTTVSSTTTTTTNGGETTTTTTTNPDTTTTTTTSSETTTTTTSVTPTTTTTTTQASYEIYNLYYPCDSTTAATQTVPNLGTYTTGDIIMASNSLCYAVADASTSILEPTQTVLSEYTSCEECQSAPTITTTTSTTTATPVEWYQLTNCSTAEVVYTQSYPQGSFALDDRVTNFLEVVFRISEVTTVDPGIAAVELISPTGQTGCPSGTTTTTTTAPAVATKIGVAVSTVQGTDLDCLGTPYTRYITTASATVYDQYNNVINAPSAISVNIRTTYNPCYGGSSTGGYTISIPSGSASAQVQWDSSRTVDCGGGNCLLETETYDCTIDNSLGLSWLAGTTVC